MTFADWFMALTGLVGAAYFAYGVLCGIAARRARRLPSESAETVCVSK